MTRSVDIPGGGQLRLEHVVLDVNGTLTDRGALIAGVDGLLRRAGEMLDVHLLSADTFGTLDEVAAGLGARAVRIGSGEEKRRLVEELGAEHCAAVGNGANDEDMLVAAARSGPPTSCARRSTTRSACSSTSGRFARRFAAERRSAPRGVETPSRWLLAGRSGRFGLASPRA